ncbi:small ribosomal subunit protein uS15m [Corythoichthys intestinalis]|uniref:small ribosomal subunit protein uS15m n=1 Tax=Corythoichthys intestinalis TaxID=161448 RepID=UPI0025A63995|nr:28S ribosomal protein S15, mitochondrial [Corythoichthys intestinalis]XP_061789161.1 small ribosomal subunit protein uS15m-like [Nerophis lumbriciformis]
MLSNVALRTVLRSSVGVLRESARTPPTCCSAFVSGHNVNNAPRTFAFPAQIRRYARTTKEKVAAPESQLSDLPPSMLKMDYTAVPLAQTTDDIVKRLLSLEMASHSEKLELKTEQLIAKVQRDESDRTSVEVKIAILTARIRNYQEHVFKHHKDKANKRRMLMAIDKRKKLLKNLRLERYDAFEKVCEQLGITYTFPPEYYRRATKRWIAKKAFCIKVFNEVKKQKAEQKLKEAAKTQTANQ